MKTFRKISILALSICLLASLCLAASAADSLDLTATGKITLNLGRTVKSGSFTLFQAADLTAADGDLVYVKTDDFSACTASLENVSSAELAEKLASYALTHHLHGTKKDVSVQGKVTFSDLPVGLYLILQEDAADGYKKVSPFCVTVPYQTSGGEYLYEVDASPKLDLEKEHTPPTTTPTNPQPNTSNLPQTGQLNWPIPVLGGAGILFLILGAVLRRREDD